MGAVTAWAKTGPSGPKYQVNFGDQVSYLKREDSLFEPPSSRWPNKSSISRNGNWSCLKCIAIMQTSKKRSRSLFKPFGMKSDLVPLAEEKANYGKIVKTAVRELWSLEYEIEEIQTEFAKGIGSIDIANLTDDFVEDVMLQSKPLQGILMAIRLRQKEKMEQIKAKYWDGVKDLEPLKAPRPPKPKDEPKPAEEKKAEAAPAEPAPAAPAAAPEVTASA